MYDTAEYANQRLTGTIIRFGREPFMVNGCLQAGNDIHVSGHILNKEKMMVVSLGDLNLEPVKLGFCNTKNSVAYLTRIPMRKDWKQGLRGNNMRSVWGADWRWVDNNSLYNCIVGNYPRFDRAVEDVINDRVPRAFCRTFAITSPKVGTLDLVYRGFGKVGDIVNGRPLLLAEKGYLIEALDRELVA